MGPAGMRQLVGSEGRLRYGEVERELQREEVEEMMVEERKETVVKRVAVRRKGKTRRSQRGRFFRRRKV